MKRAFSLVALLTAVAGLAYAAYTFFGKKDDDFIDEADFTYTEEFDDAPDGEEPAAPSPEVEEVATEKAPEAEASADDSAEQK